jgi:hypothetical protein
MELVAWVPCSQEFTVGVYRGPVQFILCLQAVSKKSYNFEALVTDVDNPEAGEPTPVGYRWLSLLSSAQNLRTRITTCRGLHIPWSFHCRQCCRLCQWSEKCGNLTLSRVRSIGRSRDSVVGIATSYRLDDWGIGVRVPVGSGIFSPPRRPDRLWGPPNLLFNGYRGALSPGVKRPGREADHSPPASAEVKKMWIYTSTPPYAFMA